MIIKLIVATWAISTCYPQLFAKNKLKTEINYLTIGKMDGESSTSLSVVNIRLDQKPSWSDVQSKSHGTYFQIELPNAITPNPGEFIDLPGPFFQKIVAFQITPQHSIARVFTSENASILEKAIDIDILNNRIVISLQHSAATTILATHNEKISNSKTKSPSQLQEAISEKKSLATSKAIIKDPIAIGNRDLTKKTIENQLEPRERTSFQKSLSIITYFSIGMILLLLATLTLRRIFRNKKFLHSPSPTVAMQTLNHLVLAPKQKLSLVQVGNEKLLLSVSPEGISLITHLNKNDSTPAKRKVHEPIQNINNQEMSALMMQTIKNRQAQVIKSPDIPPRQRPKTKATTPIPQQKLVAEENDKPKVSETKKSKAVSYMIDDDGIKSAQKKNPTEKAIEDVTQLIREKLKSLPKI